MIKINPFNPTFGDIPELFLQAENNPQDVANLIIFTLIFYYWCKRI